MPNWKKVIVSGSSPHFNHITASGDVSGSATSTASFGTYLGDGSQLTDIEAGTNLTQSLFVSPSGDNSTAIVGDIAKPFQTILSATASANIGDTIIVYPGTYLDETANIVKDGVNYYFYPGAFVSSSNSRIIDTGDLTYPINFRGNGSFETNIDNYAFKVSAPRGVFEFDLLHHKGIGSAGSGQDTLSISQPSSAPNAEILEVRGSIITSDGGNTSTSTLAIGYGNTKFDGSIVHTGSFGNAIEIRSVSADTQINAYAFARNGIALNSDIRNICTQFNGHLETGDQSTYHAVYLAGGHYESAIIHGEIIGAIYLNTGNVINTGVSISGFQRCTNSPSSLGAIDIRSGRHLLNHKIQATENIFYSAGTVLSHTIFNGQALVTSDNSGKLFDFNNPNGVFIYNGASGDANVRANSNTITAGTLIIDSYLEHYGGNHPSNEYAFDLSGGTLEINNKIKHNQITTGSGIVNMTGGYLKLNGAQLIHGDHTGSYAYAIKLNSNAHSGSILNNSFTNLTPFGPGSFTNEIIGGGTLFYSDKLY